MASQVAKHAVNFITGNKNKLGEVKAILEPTISVQSQALDLIEVQGTLEEVTIAKCRAAAEQVRSAPLLHMTYTDFFFSLFTSPRLSSTVLPPSQNTIP